MSLAAVVALAVQTRFLFLVVATIVLTQCLIASAPAPADRRGRAIASPQVAATLVAGVVAAAFAYHPLFLLGAAGTQAASDGAVATGVFAGVLPGVAAGVIVAIIGQALRRDGRPNLVRSLAAVTSLALFAAIAAAWISAARASAIGSTRVPIGSEVVTLACAAIAGGLLMWVLPFSRMVAGLLTLALGAASAAGTAVLLDSAVHTLYAAVVGAGAAGFAAMGLLVGQAWTQGRGHASAGWGFPGALAFAMTGPLVYIGAQVATAGL